MEKDRYLPRNVEIFRGTAGWEIHLIWTSMKFGMMLMDSRKNSLISKKIKCCERDLLKFLGRSSGSGCELKTVLSHETEKALIPFPTTYLCEAGFSRLVIKIRARNRLDPQHDRRCGLSINIQPRLTEKIQRLNFEGFLMGFFLTSFCLNSVFCMFSTKYFVYMWLNEHFQWFIVHV